MPIMQPILKYMDGFTVTGFHVKTQNSVEFDENTAKLPELWQKFYVSNSDNDATIFGVYSDYESDENGPYRVTAGIASDGQGKGFSSVNIHPGNYLVFQGKGTMPQAVIETWNSVWEYFTKDSQYQRCFKSDFEAYSGADEVAIYIGIN